MDEGLFPRIQRKPPCGDRRPLPDCDPDRFVRQRARARRRNDEAGHATSGSPFRASPDSESQRFLTVGHRRASRALSGSGGHVEGQDHLSLEAVTSGGPAVAETLAMVARSPVVAVAPPLMMTLLYDYENGVRLSPPKRQPILVTPKLARVFARAASVNAAAREEKVSLSFQSLLVGLMVDEDSWLAKHFEAQGVDFDAIRSKRPYDEEALGKIGAASQGAELLASVSARRALEEAGRIARTLGGGNPVDARHLCAAYPILASWHVDDFSSFRIDRLKWARAFGAEMATRFPEERAYWRTYADRASPVPLTAFSADVYTEEDLLGIDRSVDALAVVTASTRTVTPLAVGIFGPWGSGKTFFMRHMQKRILDVRKREAAGRTLERQARRRHCEGGRHAALLRPHRAGRVQRLALQRGQPHREPRGAPLS